MNRSWRRIRGVAAAGLVGVSATLSACDENSTPPVDSFRFGQVGELRVSVVTPLFDGEGEVQQVLNWNSDGPWTLREEISYQGSTGDDHEDRSPRESSAFSALYAGLIEQLNDNEALSLFIPSLDPSLRPQCGPNQSLVTFRIRDDLRNEEVTWIRCATGPMDFLTPIGSGPDPDASRVVVAAMLARDLALGDQWTSVYRGSVPFGTLDRGEGSGVENLAPRAFVLGEGESGVPPGWGQFWLEHSRGASPAPEVDWERQMVVVAGDGPKLEAGDSVEVRRVIQIDNGTQVEPVERVPGDFCSPASRRQTPFHIVVAPRLPEPIRFANIRVERVPCGI